MWREQRMPSSPSYTEARRDALRRNTLSFHHEGIKYARKCIETERFSKQSHEGATSPDRGVCYKKKREDAASKGRSSFSHDGVVYERVGRSSSYRVSKRDHRPPSSKKVEAQKTSSKTASAKSLTVSKAKTSKALKTSKAAKKAKKVKKVKTAKTASKSKAGKSKSSGKHDALSSVDAYNKAMRSLSSLGINPSTLLDLSAATPVKEYTLDQAVSKLKQTFSFDDDVSTNGIMAEVVRSIVAEKDKGDLVDALIVASRAKTTVLIKEETNAYTSGAAVKRHFNTTQRIGSSIEYVCVHGDGGACAKVHFLNWVVMTAPPLIFLDFTPTGLPAHSHCTALINATRSSMPPCSCAVQV